MINSKLCKLFEMTGSTKKLTTPISQLRLSCVIRTWAKSKKIKMRGRIRRLSLRRHMSHYERMKGPTRSMASNKCAYAAVTIERYFKSRKKLKSVLKIKKIGFKNKDLNSRNRQRKCSATGTQRVRRRLRKRTRELTDGLNLKKKRDK